MNADQMEEAASNARNRPPLVTLGITAVFACFWLLYTQSVLPWAQKHDFLSFYTGASFALQGRFAELYDPAAQLEFQQRLVPDATEIAPYIRPNFYAAALAPLALIPFPVAFGLWIASHWLLLIGCWIWAGREFGWDAMIWGVMYFPTVAGISNGQDCVWLLAIAIAGYALAKRDRDVWAGVVFGLALFKFNLLILVPVAMIAARRWRMLAGYCAAGLLTGGVFVALGGLGSLESYRALITNPGVKWLEPNPDRMINLTAISANFGLPDAVTWVLAAAVVLAVVVIARRAPLDIWLPISLLGSVLINPHAYSYDGGMLLLVVWLVIFQTRDKAARLLATAVAVPLPFFTLLIGSPWCVLPALLFTLLFVALVRAGARQRAVF